MTGPLPPFVERGGEQVVRGPFSQAETDLHVFMLRGRREALARVCAQTIEEPSRGQLCCRPLADLLMLSFAAINRMSSLDPRDREIGWMREIDVAFWIPVELESRESGRTTRRLAWLIPYIFVDSGQAMSTGREHYGFPKAHARIELPATTGRAGYRVHTNVLDHFTPTTAVREALLIELERDEAGSRRLPSMAAALELLRASAAMTSEWGPALAQGLMNVGEVPLLFLRQLRDIADPSRAVFQEIVLASARTRKLREVALLPGRHQLRLAEVASHPIAAELGLAASQELGPGIRIDFDFDMELGRTLFRHATAGVGEAPRRASKRKIAVLGGGLGSLSAVFEITEQPNWQERYEITVYQTGFRLGGKGASGRNPDACQRIEEHGLHVWFGFYHNAFALMRRCYAAANRRPGTPLADWRAAFEPHDYVCLQEQVDGDWTPWTMRFPVRPGEPADDSPTESSAGSRLGAPPSSSPGATRDWIRALASNTTHLLELSINVVIPESERDGLDLGAALGRLAFGGLSLLLRTTRTLALTVTDPISPSALTRARRELWARFEQHVERHEQARRVWLSLDLHLTVLFGLLRDRVLERGFEALDDEDFMAWLRRHGASEMTIRSPLVRIGYDLVFGYEAGVLERPNFAAGVALYGLLRMLYDYKGSVMWKMRAGMGDVVFTPLYEVLHARGVRFEFFHKVRELSLAPDGRRIDRLVVGRQATVLGQREYEPLIDVKGIGCWPDRPHYDQLVEGEALREGLIDLESSWSPWTDVATVELRDGVDFDEVILGIPPAVLPTIARDLIERKPAWRTMVEQVSTVCTHAFQLWTGPSLAELGWQCPVSASAGPVQGAYVEPSDTWADMTHLVPVEDWPADAVPGHIAYFCGPLADPIYPDSSDHEFPKRERERVTSMVYDFLDHDVGRLWPKAVDERGRFRYELLIDLHARGTGLIDPAQTPGRERLRTQMIKSNIEPSDRYTLSTAGSIRHRLPADGSGVDNLFLAGDWIDNGFNAGCVEATVMSGMQCARALTGAAIEVIGEPTRLTRVRT